MADVTLAMAEELSSLRLYYDQVRAKLSGNVITQQQRMLHLTRRVRFKLSTMRVSVAEKQSIGFGPARPCVCVRPHNSQQVAQL